MFNSPNAMKKPLISALETRPLVTFCCANKQNKTFYYFLKKYSLETINPLGTKLHQL